MLIQPLNQKKSSWLDYLNLMNTHFSKNKQASYSIADFQETGAQNWIITNNSKLLFGLYAKKSTHRLHTLVIHRWTCIKPQQEKKLLSNVLREVISYNLKGNYRSIQTLVINHEEQFLFEQQGFEFKSFHPNHEKNQPLIWMEKTLTT